MHISGTQRLFSVKYLFGEAKLPRIFYSLRKTKNLLDDRSIHEQLTCAIFEANLINSLRFSEV